MQRYLESESVELKERYTDTITKEIVSFLNGDGGTILIGVKNNGVVVGVNKIDEALRKISDIITTQIEPNPQDEIRSELRFDNGKTIVVIHINKEAGEYNLLAELLSDKNNIPLIFVKFQGKNKASISERSDYGYGCLLTTYSKIKNRLQAENICISDTTVRPRKDLYLFDYDAVNEALLNALVHNDWLVTEPQISMYDDRLEILSHGGLPNGLTKKQFFEGISKPRNATLMRIFLTMGLTEHTGHGVPTIVEKYGKKAFEIESNYIRCIIPFEKEVMAMLPNKNVGLNVGLNKTEKRVIALLIEDPSYTSVDLAEKIKVSQRTIERTFKTLQEKNIIERTGSKRDGRWIVIK